MPLQTKIPVIMRQTITQYTDIRDELEDFRDFIQDICCDIGGMIDDIDDQLDTLSDRLIAYNELAENYISLSNTLSFSHPSPLSGLSAGEELPFPPADGGNAV